MSEGLQLYKKQTPNTGVFLLKLGTSKINCGNKISKKPCLFTSGMPRPEVVGGVKPFVYRQWKLRHVTLIKWVKTAASIRTTHCRSFDEKQNVLSENLRGDKG